MSCIPSIVSFIYIVLTFGDAQGDDEENSLPHLDHGFHSKLPPGILPHGLPTVKEVAPAITPQEKKEKEEEKKESELYLENHLFSGYSLNNCFFDAQLSSCPKNKSK